MLESLRSLKSKSLLALETFKGGGARQTHWLEKTNKCIYKDKHIGSRKKTNKCILEENAHYHGWLSVKRVFLVCTAAQKSILKETTGKKSLKLGEKTKKKLRPVFCIAVQSLT